MSSEGTTVETVTADTMGSVATGTEDCALQSDRAESKAQRALQGLIVRMARALESMRSRKVQEKRYLGWNKGENEKRSRKRTYSKCRTCGRGYDGSESALRLAVDAIKRVAAAYSYGSSTEYGVQATAYLPSFLSRGRWSGHLELWTFRR